MHLTILEPNPNRSSPIYKRRVRCRLYGHPIVDELPRRCPFRLARPTDALLEMKNLAGIAVGHFGDNDGRLADGIQLQAQCEVCYGCVAANLKHPTIQRIRGALGMRR